MVTWVSERVVGAVTAFVDRSHARTRVAVIG